MRRNLLTGKSRIHRERAVESEGSRTLRLSSYEEKFKLVALSGSKERIEATTEEWSHDVREGSRIAGASGEMEFEWDWIQYHWTENEVKSTQEPVEDAEISQDLPPRFLTARRE